MFMELFIKDLRKIPRLMGGLVILSLGIYLTKLSQFGLSPWAALSDGLDVKTGIGFGYITQLIGVVVLVFSMVVFRTKVGIGTIFNVLFVGLFLEFYEVVYKDLPNQLWLEIIVFTVGLLLMTFGRSLYIASELGQGPRDGLFVGLARTTKYPVKYIKLSIELIVFLIGFSLGGRIGIGTVITVFASGYLVQFFFKVLKYDPKTSVQYSITDYIFHKKEPSK